MGDNAYICNSSTGYVMSKKVPKTRTTLIEVSRESLRKNHLSIHNTCDDFVSISM